MTITAHDSEELQKLLGKNSIRFHVIETCVIRCDPKREKAARAYLRKNGFGNLGSGHPIENGFVFFDVIEVVGTK
jgi:hypothetical protein